MSASAAREAHNGVEPTGVFPWWLVLIEGCAAVIIGVLLFLAPQATLELVLQLFGLYWLVVGVLRLANAFTDPLDRGLKIFVGIVGILAGFAVTRHPALLAVMMTWMLVAFLGGAGIVIGAISLFLAFRGHGWGAGIVGVVSLLFGLLVLFNPWLTGIAWVYLYAGVSLVGGVVAIVWAFRMRTSSGVAVAAADPTRAGQVVNPDPT